MAQANHSLSQDDRHHVESAIASAERATSAEIVVAVATESGRYDRAESIVGLAGAWVALALLEIAIAWPMSGGSGSWAQPAAHLGLQCLAVVAGFVIGTTLASWSPALRRVAVARREAAEEVAQAATLVFADASIRGTLAGCGVLIYVSLAERRLVVLADQGARPALPDAELEAVRDAALPLLKQGQLAEALVAAVERAANPLAASLPAERDDVNELPDHVITYHPRPIRRV